MARIAPSFGILARLFAVAVAAMLVSIAMGWRPQGNNAVGDLDGSSSDRNQIPGIPRKYDAHLKQPSRMMNRKQMIIEVGTNVAPDFLDLATRSSSFFIGLEPTVFDKAKRACRSISHRCLMLPFAIGPKNYMAKMNKGFVSKCSSLLPLPAETSSLTACNRNMGAVDVPVITLDVLFNHLVPREMPIKLLALDMQGFDLQGASSLRNKERRGQIANFMLECQDLPVGDKDFISPGAGSCGEAVDCITKHWGFELDGCWPNEGKAEYNCGFSNPSNPHRDRRLRPAYKGNASSHTIEYPKPCPSYFTQGDTVR